MGCFFDFLAGYYYLVGSYSVTLSVVRGMGVTPIVGAGHIASDEGRRRWTYGLLNLMTKLERTPSRVAIRSKWKDLFC